MSRNTPYFVGLVLFVTFLLSAAMTPREIMADKRTQFVLDDIIPDEFGDWRRVKEVNASSQISLYANRGEQVGDLIYEQTMMRTYKHKSGARVMLALAYGATQRSELTLHKPEVCYVSQGFQIIDSEKTVILLNDKSIPIKRLLAKSGSRVEPITYWIRVGDYMVDGGSVSMKLAVVKEGLSGRVPDGVLFRVSSIAPSMESVSSNYNLHNKFIKELVNAVDLRNVKTLFI